MDPRLLRALVGLGLLTLVVPAAHAQNQVPACVEVEGVARWAAAAYNHWVVVRNRCDHPVQCTVATDVSPDPIPLRVEASETGEVLTRRGSPAREFTPAVRCERP